MRDLHGLQCQWPRSNKRYTSSTTWDTMYVHIQGRGERMRIASTPDDTRTVISTSVYRNEVRATARIPKMHISTRQSQPLSRCATSRTRSEQLQQIIHYDEAEVRCCPRLRLCLLLQPTHIACATSTALECLKTIMLPTGWLSLPIPTSQASTSGEARLGLLMMPRLILLFRMLDGKHSD